MSAPVIVRGRVIWPWYLTADERAIIAGRVRAETLDVPLLDRVLEERTLRANGAAISDSKIADFISSEGTIESLTGGKVETLMPCTRGALSDSRKGESQAHEARAR